MGILTHFSVGSRSVLGRFFALIFGVFGMARADDGVGFATSVQEWGTHATFKARVNADVGSAWRIERSLGVESGWFGFSSRTVGDWQSSVTDVDLKSYAIVPPVPSYPAAAPWTRYTTPMVKVIITLAVRPSDGAAWLQWPSLESGGNQANPPLASCHLTPAAGFEVRKHFSSPAEPAGWRSPRGAAICWTEPSPAERLAGVPTFDLFFLTAPQYPVAVLAPSTLGPMDSRVRDAILAVQPTLFARLWPADGGTVVLPEPPSFDTRGFFRLRSQGRLPDADNNGVPDAFQAFWTPPAPAAPHLVFSEVCYSSGTGTYLMPVPGSPPLYITWDWVEFINPTNSEINTEGCFLTDKASAPGRHPLPAVLVPPGGHLVLFLSGVAPDGRPQDDAYRHLHVPFGLKDEGESIYLYHGSAGPGGAMVYTLQDQLIKPPSGTWPSGPLPDVSWGRCPDDSPSGFSLGFFQQTTPGASNDRWVAATVLEAPLVKDLATGQPLAGKFFKSGVINAVLESPQPGAAITYTLDGSEPTPESTIYEEPIQIHHTAVLRARCFRTDSLPSRSITRTFIHPVTSMATAAALRTSPAALYPGMDVAATWGYATPPARGAGYEATSIVQQLENRPAIFISFTEPPPQFQVGTDPEFPASFEYCDPSDPAAYRQENIHLQRTGQSGTRGSKLSYDILFKGAAAFSGKSGWQGPVASDGTSRIFPGSKVTRWHRLKIRNPGTDCFDFLDLRKDMVYLSDAWMKETQRALGGFTGQRRWVHVWFNGVFAGLYDLEEFHDPLTISAHLAAALPTDASPASRAAVADGNIEFLGICSNAETPGAMEAYRTLIKKCAAAALAPADASKWDALVGVGAAGTEGLAIQDYIRYLCALEFVGKRDHYACQYRAWRHPVTRLWHFIAWDGDWVEFRPSLTDRFLIGESRMMEDLGQLDFDTPYLTDLFFGVELDEMPFEILKNHPRFKAEFSAVLHAAAFGPLSVPQLTARFDAMALDVRRSIEAEAMRWGDIDRLDEWSSSYVEEFNGISQTFYRGVESVRRFVVDDTAMLDADELPRATLRALLNRARALGLYNH